MTYRPELSEIPERIRRLPVARGYPVPWFVQWLDGVPEFRVMDAEKFVRAIKEKRCWVCGDTLGRNLAFVVGPMCAVNRTSAEPPAHRECGEWSARFCPFLSRPHMVRREDDVINSSLAGEASLARNPGVTAVWLTRGYTLFKAPKQSASGYLIEIGDPLAVLWYAEGRPATRAEVVASLDSGMPALAATVELEAEANRPAAFTALATARAGVDALLPA